MGPGMQIRSFDDLAAGLALPEFVRQLDTLDFVTYCGAADDYARQHWDHLHMTGLGFPGVVGHGWLTFACMCQAVTDCIPLEIADIRSYAVRYHRPTLPGLLRCGGEVVSKQVDDDGRRRAELRLWARDAEGQTIASSPMVLEFV
jgi:acyl dehydratase